MNFIRRFFRLGDEVLDKLELRDERAINSMVYAYIKCMPLVVTEMGMRQNLSDVGKLVRIPDFKGKPAWGAWLALTITSFTIDIPEGSTIYIYDAWNVARRTERGPGSFLVHYRGYKYADFHSLLSDTAVVRVVITTEYEEDGEQIYIRYIDPLISEYVSDIVSTDISRAAISANDPTALTGREYFALVNSLVSVNPTKDAKIMKGLNYTDAAPAAMLETVKRRALIEMHVV